MKKTWFSRFALAAFLVLPLATFAAEPIVIGASIALTGPASSLGADESKAFNLAVGEINATGGIAGHPLELNVLDGGGDPQKDVLNVRKLITSGNAVGVICCTTTPSSMTVIDTVQHAGVPTISIAASAAIVQPVSERHWIFKTPPLDATMMGPMVKDMRKQGVKTLGFIGFSDAFGQGGLSALKSALEGTDIKPIDVEQFARTDTNVNAQAAKLVAAKPDAVLIWAIPPGANVAQKGLQEAGYKGQIYQNYGVTNETFLRLGGASLNGTRISAQPMVIPDKLPDSLAFKPVIEKFVRNYKAAHGGAAPSPFAAQAFDAVSIFAAAAKTVVGHNGAALPPTGTFRSELRDAIENLGQFQGVDGTFNFSRTDHVGLDESSAAMIRIENGAYEFIH
jgi:branched-chain amino acid transport system substrate-binding protein